MAGRCEFVFRPTYWPTTSSRLTDPEPCPYPSLPGSDFCAFHNPGLVSMLCSTPAEVADVYRETVQSVGVLKLLGCTVLHLDCQRLKGVLDQGQPVSIGYSTFEAPLDFSQFDFEQTVTIAGCTIPSLSLQETSIGGYLNLWDSTVASFDLRKAELQGDAHFENTVFGDATFIDILLRLKAEESRALGYYDLQSPCSLVLNDPLSRSNRNTPGCANQPLLISPVGGL